MMVETSIITSTDTARTIFGSGSADYGDLDTLPPRLTPPNSMALTAGPLIVAELAGAAIWPKVRETGWMDGCDGSLGNRRSDGRTLSVRPGPC